MGGGSPAGHAPPRPADLRTPTAFLIWLARSQWPRILRGMVFGSAWMVSLALPPYLLSRAIDDGLGPGDSAALLGWAGALLGAGGLVAFLSIARHRTMSRIRMDASFRTVRATVRHCAYLGASLRRRSDTGEVTAVGIADVRVVAQSLTVTGPGLGAVVAYVVVAVVLVGISPPLALFVLAGVPLLAVTVGPLLQRIERTGSGYRDAEGVLTRRLVDLLAGLPVLNGVGGKRFHQDRYARQSQHLVTLGHHVGRPASWVGALATGLPALLLAAVTWPAARTAAQGGITVGELVAVYGYLAMLVVPVAALIEGAGDIARGLVSATRVVRLLRLEPDRRAGPAPVPIPDDGPLADPASGVVIGPGALTALVGDDPAAVIAVVDRLGGLGRTDATWAGVRLDALDPAGVRERVLVADHDAALFAGTVREAVAGRHRADDDRIRAAVHTAAADDVVAALPGGLDARLVPGATTLSGGQRQRLRLARAVYADPQTLLAVEPTSAVDATTEAAIADRLRVHRAGRTTVVVTSSPLLLDRADRVVFVAGGVAVACGTHRELSAGEPGYRAVVARNTGTTP
ncbi:ABC transporter ATP-binding protein [Pseudonocardia nematodicida]|uniref:ABC transporter ATP-binding protein n=1 Tax=Pseudonocardia nematodicida TaxID=1206997 RepID=A0ABV1KGR1_9PSEU